MKIALRDKERRPPVPVGVEMVKVDYKTGNIIKSENKNILTLSR